MFEKDLEKLILNNFVIKERHFDLSFISRLKKSKKNKVLLVDKKLEKTTKFTINNIKYIKNNFKYFIIEKNNLNLIIVVDNNTIMSDLVEIKSISKRLNDHNQVKQFISINYLSFKYFEYVESNIKVNCNTIFLSQKKIYAILKYYFLILNYKITNKKVII